MDAQSSLDSADAAAALVDIGIQKVQPDAGELDGLLATMSVTNRDMAKNGVLPLELFETMQGHINDYRTGTAGTANGN
jgi:hypothetical protein